MLAFITGVLLIAKPNVPHGQEATLGREKALRHTRSLNNSIAKSFGQYCPSPRSLVSSSTPLPTAMVTMVTPVTTAPWQWLQPLEPGNISRVLILWPGGLLNTQKMGWRRLTIHPSASRQGLQRIFFKSNLSSGLQGLGKPLQPSGVACLEMESHSCFKPHLGFVDPLSQETAPFRMQNAEHSTAEQARRALSHMGQAVPPPPPTSPTSPVIRFLRNHGRAA